MREELTDLDFLQKGFKEERPFFRKAWAIHDRFEVAHIQSANFVSETSNTYFERAKNLAEKKGEPFKSNSTQTRPAFSYFTLN